MKKTVLLLFAILCATCLFTACSDDDDKPGWKDIPKEFPATSTGIHVNGTEVDGSVTFNVTSDDAAIVSLENIIPAYSEKIDIPVVMEKTADGSFQYEGEKALEAPAATTPSSRADEQAEPYMLVQVNGKVFLNNNVYDSLTVNLTTSGWYKVSGQYQGDSCVSITVNNVPQKSDLDVRLTATSANKVKVYFEKIANVGIGVEVEATYTKNADESYSIQGSSEKKPGYLITVNGLLSADGKLQLKVKTTGYATLEKSYYVSSKSLILTYNNSVVTDGNIQISEVTENSATVSVNGLIPGEGGTQTVEIKNVTLTKAGETETYMLSGKSETESYEIFIEANISSEWVMTARVNYGIKSSLVGKWNVKMNGNVADCIFNITTQQGKIAFSDTIVKMLPDELKNVFGDSVPDATFSQTIKGLLSQYIPFLNSIEFTPGGNIKITYTDMTTQTPGELNILNYYIKDNQVYALIDLSAIMGMLPTSRAWDWSNILTDGIPLDFIISGNTLNISLNQDVTTGILQFAGAMLPMFGQMIPPDIFGLIMLVVTEANTIMTDSTSFEVGLVMTKE